MEHDKEITAIILAGGRSSRMGRDKALIPIRGVPLLQRIATLALECTSTVYIVTPWLERYQNVVPSGCTLVREVPYSGESVSHGPLVGFAQGLALVQTEWVLLLACDLPQLRSAEVSDWFSYLAAVSPEKIALLPRHFQGWEPLCGFYRRRCLLELNQFIDRGGRSFQQWLAKQPVEELTVSDRRQLFNCNTPTDLEQVINFTKNTNDG